MLLALLPGGVALAMLRFGAEWDDGFIKWWSHQSRIHSLEWRCLLLFWSVGLVVALAALGIGGILALPLQTIVLVVGYVSLAAGLYRFPGRAANFKAVGQGEGPMSV